MKTQEELSSEEMGRTIVALHNEIVLLKEQIRVADVAYQYLHGEYKRVRLALEEAAQFLEPCDCEALPTRCPQCLVNAVISETMEIK